MPFTVICCQVFFTEAFYMCLLMGVWSTMDSALMNETGFGSVIQAQLTFIYDDLVRRSSVPTWWFPYKYWLTACECFMKQEFHFRSNCIPARLIWHKVCFCSLIHRAKYDVWKKWWKEKKLLYKLKLKAVTIYCYVTYLKFRRFF